MMFFVSHDVRPTFDSFLEDWPACGRAVRSAEPGASGIPLAGRRRCREISVSGVPELRQRAPVQLDGSITFPVIGTFMVEGVEFSEIRDKIQSAVASKIFRIRTPDGRELSRMFDGMRSRRRSWSIGQSSSPAT